MRLKDRKLLLKLITIDGVSRRELAQVAGYSGSHTHIQRLLDGRTDQLAPERAAAVAERLGVDVARLFAPADATSNGHKRTGQMA